MSPTDTEIWNFMYTSTGRQTRTSDKTCTQD